MKANVRRRMSGLSLIELMIAMVIGLVLIIGVIQIFSASRAAYQMSEGLARVQENARFAADFLERDIRMAGHYGCVNDQSHLQTPGALVTHFGPAPAFALDFFTSIVGFDATGTSPGGTVVIGSETNSWSPALPADVLNDLNPNAGSDVIVLRYLSALGAPLISMDTAGGTIGVSAARWDALTDDGVANPVLFGVSDCSYVDIFQGAVPAAGTVTLDPAFGLVSRYTVQPAGQTMLYRADSLVYYVGTGAGGGPSLFRARFNGSNYVPEELVEGVENLQFLYGQDSVTDLTTSPPSGYMASQGPASAITPNSADNWRRVGLVQVGILVRSPDAASAQAPESANRSFALGLRFDPSGVADGRYRESYEFTIALRNRLYGN